MKRSDKNKYLTTTKPKKYKIFGIFCFSTNKLIYVTLKKEDAEFEFDMEGYDSNRYDIISFHVLLA